MMPVSAHSLRSGPKVALVHDWLTGQRGGEQVLLALCRMFPGAPIYTLVHEPGRVHPRIEAHPIVTSIIQRGVRRGGGFRHLLPLFAPAMEAFDLSSFDVVVSSSHCVAHGVITKPSCLHVAYVHSPMRYLYDQLAHYLPGRGQALTVPAMRWLSGPLRRWDRRAAQRPDVLVANSAYVARRIERVWGRTAHVAHPPVDVDAFALPAHKIPRRGLLWVGALVPYKRVDVAIGTSMATGVPLTVVGRGPEEARLRAMAGPQVRFVSHVSQAELAALYASHEALIYCGEEDFGIAPVEAMAAGCPVLGYGRGGLTETVRVAAEDPAHATGVLTSELSVAAFVAGLQALRRLVALGALQGPTLAQHAQSFAPQAFTRAMARLTARPMAPPQSALTSPPRGTLA